MNWVTQLCLPLVAMIVTFGVGLGVAVDQLAATVRRPRSLLLGLLLSLTVLPALGYLAVITTGGNASILLGIVILAASPSNVACPLLTRLARGDVALSLTLTSVTCVLTALVMP